MIDPFSEQTDSLTVPWNKVDLTRQEHVELHRGNVVWAHNPHITKEANNSWPGHLGTVIVIIVIGARRRRWSLGFNLNDFHPLFKSNKTVWRCTMNMFYIDELAITMTTCFGPQELHPYGEIFCCNETRVLRSKTRKPVSTETTVIARLNMARFRWSALHTPVQASVHLPLPSDVRRDLQRITGREDCVFVVHRTRGVTDRVLGARAAHCIVARPEVSAWPTLHSGTRKNE